MLRAIRTRISQGRQYVPDVRGASPRGFRGLPVLSEAPCASGCSACMDICPTRAIAKTDGAEPNAGAVSLDLGRCVFCNACAEACPSGKIDFTNDYKMAAGAGQGLVVREGEKKRDPVEVSAKLRRLFGRSLRLRSVSSGGCNACELEVGALSNVNFDIGRWGIEMVASPRHADGLVLSGPLTRNMSRALEIAYEALPPPRFVVAVGACALSGGVFAESSALDRGFLDRFPPTLSVPGCPPHPLTFVNGILDLLGIA